MIIYDQPVIWNPKYGLSCHLISTLLNGEGTQELISFVKKINLNEKYIQQIGQPTEHFDVFGSKLTALREIIPYPVTRKEFIEFIRYKRKN